MKKIEYTMHRDILMEGFEPGQDTCHIDPIPFRTPDGRMHIAYRDIYLGGSDVFLPSHVISSEDGGLTFGEPQPFIKVPDIHENGVRTYHSLLAYYHKAGNQNYVLGRITRYSDDHGPVLTGQKIMPALTGEFDPATMEFTQFHEFDLPGLEDYDTLMPFSVLEEKAGTVLIAFYGRKGNTKVSKVIIARFEIREGKLVFLERGEPISKPELARGIGEPRLAHLGNTYYLTVRSDEIGMMSKSSDGLNYSEPEIWHWDDGEILTSRNTMQGWLQHPDGLFLVYTRETPHNKHIFRRRAPLFMARFDEERDCLVKDTEVIVVPEMGARIGNFYVTPMKDNEAWITVFEWMQTTAPNPLDSSVCYRYGARNRLWRTRIVW